jgi:lipopolysaccharide transport system permease protein
MRAEPVRRPSRRETTDQGFDLVIEARQPVQTYWMEAWRARELVLFLAGRDLLVRYKQTAVGIAWSVLRPVITMLVFTFVFSRVARLPSESDAPYAVLVYAAMLPYTFFAGAFSDASGSLVASASIITKVYFPRVLVPLSAVAVSAVDFLISLLVLLALMLALHATFSWRLLLLPVLLLPALLTALGLGLGLGALNVKYRDVRHLVPLLTQFSLYLSPVGYSSSVVPDAWRLAYSVNPLVGVIDAFRWAVLHSAAPLYAPAQWLAWIISALCVLWGVWTFRRFEREFADVI